MWVFAVAFVLARFVFTQGNIVCSGNSWHVCRWPGFSHLLLTYTATVIFEHPEDVTVEPNVWANFSCTVHCLFPVKWYKAGHSNPIEDLTIDGLKFIESSNSTCTSENKTIHFLDVLATKQIHNLAFYCAAYETCQRCPQTGCKCGCDRCYSGPALLTGKPCCVWISLWLPHSYFLYSNHIVQTVATVQPTPTPSHTSMRQGRQACNIVSYVLTVEQHLTSFISLLAANQ